MERNRRWIELGKDALIVLLAVSALVLLFFSPLVQASGLPELFSKRTSDGKTGAVTTQTIPTAAVPLQMSVGTGLGLYGIQYDQSAVDSLFAEAGPLLGEALEYAGSPRPLSEIRLSQSESITADSEEECWQALLGGVHIYFGYDEAVPLETLRVWLKPEGSASALNSSTRRILLTALSNGTLALCYQDADGGYYFCTTGLDVSLHLDPIVESVTPNGAFYAFEDEALAAKVDPCTLFTDQSSHVPIYSSLCPVSLSESAQVTQLLSALSFSDLHRAEGSDAAIYVDGDDTVRIYVNGVVRCHASKDRYKVSYGLTGAIDGAWSLASAAIEPLCGDARLNLLSAQEEDGVYTVSFGYCLNGCPVYLQDQGWAAQFTIQDGSITDFTLCLRSYTAGEQIMLLSAEKAADTLTALTEDPCELVLRYTDNGGTVTEPNWVGR